MIYYKRVDTLKLFKTKEEKAKILLHNEFSELYTLTDDEMVKVRYSLNTFIHGWGDVYNLYNQYTASYDHRKTISIRKEIAIVEDRPYIDGVRSPKLKDTLKLIIINGTHNISVNGFDGVDEICDFIWSD